MKKIINTKLLNSYIDKYNIKNIFEKDISSHMELHFFDKGEQIYRANEKTDYFYFLVQGKFKVLAVQKNGKALLLRFYGPFEAIGDVELMGSLDPLCTLEVLDPVTCIAIPMKILREQFMGDTKFLQYIGKSLAVKLMESSNSSAINLLYPLESRLASYILAISPDKGKSKNIVGFATNKLTEMADFLGTSYRHLNRTLRLLSEKNLIRKGDSFIEILDREELHKLAGDLYK